MPNWWLPRESPAPARYSLKAAKYNCTAKKVWYNSNRSLAPEGRPARNGKSRVRNPKKEARS